MAKRKRKIAKINSADNFRVLDTEVLPYEVPIWLSNRHFHVACAKKHITYNAGTINIFNAHIEGLSITIPLEYQIAKDDNATRTIGIMHPLSQLKVVDFYKKYSDVIPYYCQFSQNSLRYPWVIAKSVRTSDDAEDESDALDMCEELRPHEDGDVSCINFLDTYCSSFYVYRKINFFYKFYESYEFHKLEKKFTKYIQVDIAKCFNSIYTHSIAWAIKGKSVAKKNAFVSGAPNTFEHDFDELMQNINYKETHGILVGPELSRIFAEIIFQRIDNNLVSELENNKPPLKHGIDYEFSRYVDDYIIFYNDTDCADHILTSLRKVLAEYKLYLNDSKTQCLKRPFISSISLCKLSLREYLKELYADRYADDGTLVRINNPSREANSIIIKIKAILKTHSDVSYKSISGYLLSEFSRYVKIFLCKAEKLNHDQYGILRDYVLVDIDVIYFILSMDIRVRTTDIVSRIILYLVKFPVFIEKNHIRSSVHKKIFDSCRNILDNLEYSNDKNCIEKCNILLLLSSLDDEFKLSENYLRKIFTLESSLYISYFAWISLMLFCKDNVKYKEAKTILLDFLNQKFIDNTIDMCDTENFMFLLDAMACPYIPQEQKRKILDSSRDNGLVVFSNDKDLDNFISQISRQNIFVDWKNNEWLFEMSKRKMYIFPYE